MPFEAANNIEVRTEASLVDALCAAGLLAENEKPTLEEILQKSGAALDQALSRLGLVTEEALADFYADHFALPRCRRTNITPPAELIRRANRRFLERYRILPVANGADNVAAIIVDPADHRGLQDLAFALDAEIAPEIVTASQFERIYSQLFSDDTAEPVASDAGAVTDDASKLKDLASAARDRIAYGPAHLLQQVAQAAAQPGVRNTTTRQFPFKPIIRRSLRRRLPKIRRSEMNHISENHARKSARSRSDLWVIESLGVCLP